MAGRHGRLAGELLAGGWPNADRRLAGERLAVRGPGNCPAGGGAVAGGAGESWRRRAVRARHGAAPLPGYGLP